MSSVGYREKEPIKRPLRKGMREFPREMFDRLDHNQKRWWVRPWIQRGEELGASSRLF